MTDGTPEPGPEPNPSLSPDPRRAVAGVVVGALAMAAGAMVAFGLLKQPPPPPPAEIAGDPFLVQGRTLYLERCVNCHGAAGKGDGPIAKGVSGPSVRDLTLPQWKYGDAPEQALAVVSNGIPKAAMPGWKSAFGDEGVRAVTAYVYFLAGRAVPPSLRNP